MTEETYLSERHFDFARLKTWCEMHETEVGAYVGAETFVSSQHRAPENFYLFKDNGSNILAVAHLDTCVRHEDRTATYVEKARLVYSGALDDRLGAYIIADLLPKMGMTFDLLLTVGEESGQSTAEAFTPERHHDRRYNWIIEFDRGGTDVVLYQYEDEDLVARVEDTGAKVSPGIFSDIAFMEHLGIKGINWGVGYRDYHSVRGHVPLDDLFEMVDYFVDFHADNADTHLPHTGGGSWFGGGVDDWSGWDDECEAAQWEVGPCEGSLTEDPALGTLCEAHERWANTP